MSRLFHIGDVLSITSGKLVSPSHIGGVYEICDYMTGESNMTHQLPRVSREIEPELRRQHPELSAVEVPSGIDSEEKVHAFLATLYPWFGDHVEVEPVDEIDHTHIDPTAEIKMMRPDIIIIDPEEHL
ncbi:hypothetical protein [Microbacterium sp. 1P06AB]|uniref:DUF7736 domain-containing protein n=1 Tax=Microbacterium sp. 1P06AB TaxID=3132289 RepID=UPI0039A41C88